jgi:hypothetical protein
VVAKTTQALLNDRSLAEDAAQEAWLDVWRGLPTLPNRQMACPIKFCSIFITASGLPALRRFSLYTP